MMDKLLKGVEFGQDLNADFIDLRFQNKYLADYQTRDGDMTSMSGSRRGVSTRVLVNGAWGFASTTSIELKHLKTIVKEATNLAKGAAGSKKEKSMLAEVKPHKDKVISPRIKLLQDFSTEEKIKLLMEIEKVFKDYEAVKSYTLSYNELIDHRLIANSEGTEIELVDMKPTISAYAVATRGTKMAGYSKACCKTKGFEMLDEHSFEDIAKIAAEKAVRNLDATLPPAGSTKVVIDETIVGVLAHEAVGHCSEADLVYAGSFLKGKLEQKVCSELVTLVDNPVLDDASGWLPYDDEGTKAEKVEIIKEGVFNGYLTSREFAAKLGVPPSGNARAFTFKDEPIIRMTNTYIEPGDMTEEELFEAIGNGYFMTGMMNGSADTSGEFMVGTGQAIKIKNGKLTDEVYIGPTMTGNAFEVLSTVLGIGKELKLNCGAGFCGKEQPAKVDAGGGKLACTVIIGGQ